MVLTIEAVFDGKVFRPLRPIHLLANSRVQIAITTEEDVHPVSFLDVAESLKLDGPPDWSSNLDAYLYGDKELNGQ